MSSVKVRVIQILKIVIINECKKKQQQVINDDGLWWGIKEHRCLVQVVARLPRPFFRQKLISSLILDGLMEMQLFQISNSNASGMKGQSHLAMIRSKLY